MTSVAPQVGYRSLLRNRFFLQLWLAQLISQTIQNAANYGLLVLIAEVTGSSTLIGLAIISFSLPAVLFGVPAGVIVDRINRRHVLWMSNLLRGLCALGFVVNLIIDRHDVLPVYILTFIIAVISQFFTPAEGAAIPLLVDERELVNALSLFNITFTLAQALGFVLLGPVILNVISSVTIAPNLFATTLDSVQFLYLIIGLAFFLCAVLTFLLPNRFFVLKREALGARADVALLRRVLGEIGESWRFVYRDRRLLIALLQLSFGSVLLLVIGQLAPKFVVELLHRPPANAALVFVPAGVGLVVGSALMPRVVKRLGKARSISAGIIGLSVTSILLVVCQRLAERIDPLQWFNDWPFLALIMALIFALGCELDLMTIPALTLVQEHTPDTIKGRVLSLQSIIYNAASIPVILFIGGIADLYGIATVMWVLAGMVFVGGLLSVALDARIGAQSAREAPAASPELSNEATGLYEEKLESLLPSNIQK
ncbi:MAG TPA: MFS transporter [Ktedonobacterales bacterium]|jgi:MFS family permease